MKNYQHEFIELAIACKALRFGEFTLKSGRVSPYFFNAGLFHSGAAIAKLGRYYAQAMVDANLEFDMLFGPAYKGIPLAAATGIAFADVHNKDLPYVYNRKEEKTHGEGGSLVGAPLQGRIAIVDDVITAGTAVREVLSIIEQHKAQTVAVVVGLNRQERGKGERSAIQELYDEHHIPVLSIVNLTHILEYLTLAGELSNVDKVQRYRDRYGVDE